MGPVAARKTCRVPAQPAAWAALLLAVAVTGCDQALTINTPFPEPLVEPLPYDVGVYITPEFAGFTYREDVPNDSDWTIDIGAANVALFERVLGRVFRSAARVPSRQADPATGLAAIIEPSIQAFEFSLPRQSATDQYAVWIRYNLAVYDPAGNLLTNWTVNAFGQTGSQAMRPARSMEQATIRAMRDAAATISVGFADETRIRERLRGEDPGPANEGIVQAPDTPPADATPFFPEEPIDADP